jgi:hypothetical protein
MANPPGYSGTPLAKKLGIGEDCVIVPRHAPDDYARLLAPLPPGVRIATRVTGATDLVHLFTVSRPLLERELTRLRQAIRPDCAIRVSWPKKASKVPTDITEDTIREVCLPMGLVDTKVCAVSEVWSGLRLVIRKAQRQRLVAPPLRSALGCGCSAPQPGTIRRPAARMPLSAPFAGRCAGAIRLRYWSQNRAHCRVMTRAWAWRTVLHPARVSFSGLT